MKNFKTLAQATFMVLLLVGVFASYLELRQLNNNLTRQNLLSKNAAQVGLKNNQSNNINEPPNLVQEVKIVEPWLKYYEYVGKEEPETRFAIPVVIISNEKLTRR